MRLSIFLKRLRSVDYLILILLVLGVLFSYFFLNQSTKVINILVFVEKTTPDQAYSLKINDSEKNSSGKEIAKIQKINIYDDSEVPNVQKKLLINTSLLVKENPRTGDLEFKNRIIKVGSPIELRFESGIISGTILSFNPNVMQSETKKIVTLALFDQYPYLASNLKKYMKSEENQKSTFLLAVEDTASPITTYTSTGEIFVKSNPLKQDLIIQVKLPVRIIGPEIIFEKDSRIAVGQNISLSIGQVWIKDAHIVDIK